MADDDNDLPWTLATLMVAGMTLAFLLLWVTNAPASAVCLTKKEARELWPRSHLYWYSRDHCWSNRRGGPPTGIKIERINMIMAQADTKKSPPLPAGMWVKWGDYNALDAQADRDVFFNAEPFPYWAHVMDVDLSRYKTWYERIETWRERR